MSDETKTKVISAVKTFMTAFVISILVVLSDKDLSISWTAAFWIPLFTAAARAGITAVIDPLIPVRLGGKKSK